SDERRSGLRRRTAGSPVSPAESSSLTLRTGRSPPVASHPLSPRRSYLQIQAGERLPEKDFHLSDQTHLQTHHPVPAAPTRSGRATRGGPAVLSRGAVPRFGSAVGDRFAARSAPITRATQNACVILGYYEKMG